MLDRLRNGVRAFAQVCRGLSGLHTYDQYVAHYRVRHPELPPLSREEFFRRELTEKWNGVRRCC